MVLRVVADGNASLVVEALAVFLGIVEGHNDSRIVVGSPIAGPLNSDGWVMATMGYFIHGRGTVHNGIAASHHQLLKHLLRPWNTAYQYGRSSV